MGNVKTGGGVLTPSRVAYEGALLLVEFQQYNSVLLYVIRERGTLPGNAADTALAKLRSYARVLDEWHKGLSHYEGLVTSAQVSIAPLVTLVARTRAFYVEQYLFLATAACAEETSAEDFDTAVTRLFGTFDATGAYAIVENLLQAIIDHAQVLARVGVAIQKLNDLTTRST